MDQGINSGFVVLIGGLSLIPQWSEMIGTRYPCSVISSCWGMRFCRMHKAGWTDSCNYSYCCLWIACGKRRNESSRMTLKWLLNRSQLPPDGRVLLRRTASYERLQHNRHVDVPGTALKVKFLSVNSKRLLGLRKNANKALHSLTYLFHMSTCWVSRNLSRFADSGLCNLIWFYILFENENFMCAKDMYETATSRLHSPQAIVKVWGRLVIESRQAHRTAFRMIYTIICYVIIHI